MCFVKGCTIATPGGGRPVESLKPGDLVATLDGAAETVLWVGRSRITWAEQMSDQRKRPIRIGREALGPGTPERAVMIAPTHRVLVRSPQVSRLAGEREALVPALALTPLPGVRLMPSLPELDYIHLACARHVLLLAEGAGVESILPEPLAVQAMAPTQRIDLAETLGWAEGHWQEMRRVRPILSMRKAEKLVERSMRSRMPLVVPLRETPQVARIGHRAG
ncbi:Hint domain-containing protein [Sagittula salina]|uniref:Hint domain-containing protein n=1 Tax=Sagittula salina TaxID=2820268 RepID=A0A940MR06_9RHOB|nr:Hint domain-containing protein [Sagittula salina]MBP0483819.1 Hint domain-containing protein [Sagittula salina]